MKKRYKLAVICAISVIIIAIVIYLYLKNSNSSYIDNSDEIYQVSEKVDDECTEEWEELNAKEKTEILETNYKENKISPNCLLNLKRHYKDCDHSTEEYIDIPTNLINKTREEFEKEYPDWKIEKFSNTEIIISKEYNGECGEHFILREEDNKIIIYKINDKKEEEIYEKTEISVDYLTDEDKKNIKDGIKVNGIQELNQLIEDFE